MTGLKLALVTPFKSHYHRVAMTPTNLDLSPALRLADERTAVKLVLDGEAGRREYATTVGEALLFDFACDHAAGTCESPEDSDTCYYEEIR